MQKVNPGIKVVNIEFERIWMDWIIECSSPPDIKTIHYAKFKKITKNEEITYELQKSLENDNLKVIKISKNLYKIRQNLACINKRDFLFGKWRIFINEVNDSNYLAIDTENTEKIANISNLYHLQKEKFVYSVAFKISFRFDEPTLLIRCFYSKISKKNNLLSFKRIVRMFVKFLSKLFLKILYKLFMRLRKQKSILLYSDTHKKLSNQLNTLLENLKEYGQEKEKFKVFTTDLSNGFLVNIIKYVKALWNISSAKYIIIDNYTFALSGLTQISPKTKIIQIWHANEGFKAVGFARFGLKGSPKIDSFYKLLYKVLVLNEKTIPIYEEVFGIPKKDFLPFGRINISQFTNKTLTKSRIEKVYSKNPELINKRIILFAPTFRGAGQRDAYYNFENIDIEKLYKSLKTSDMLIIKMHPFTRNLNELTIQKSFKDKIKIIDSQTTIDDLYYVTDILITDYSSAYSDFSYFKKPILFFTPDRIQYQVSRGVNNDILSYAPGKVCDTFEELLKSLRNEDFELSKTIEYSNNMYKNMKSDTAKQLSEFIIEDSKNV